MNKLFIYKFIFSLFIILYLLFQINITTNDKNIKLLFFVASYGIDQLNLLYMQIKSFLDICEGGINIKIIIHHTNILNNSSFRSFYCFRMQTYLDIEFIKISHKVHHLLVKEHRKYIVNNKNILSGFNHIGFFENDIRFSLTNFNYYKYTLNAIKENNIKNAIPGFKRYELYKCSNGDIWRSCQDHIKNVTFYYINNKMFIRIRHGYSAMWLLPLETLLKHINEKGFLNIPENEHNGNEGLKPYYSYNYWEKYYFPIIPLDRIDQSFVHHMSNKYIHYFASIQLTEFYMQIGLCKRNNNLIYIGKKQNRSIAISISNLKKHCVQLMNC